MRTRRRVLFPTFYGNNDIAAFNCAFGPFSQIRDEVEIVTPFPLMAKQKDIIESTWWTDFRYWLGIDVCFLHRPCGWYGQQLISAAKSHGVPLWVHHDDDLLAIPETNPYHSLVKHDMEFPSVEASYREADVLSCQSVLMKKMLSEKYERKDVKLIPISLDDRLIRLSHPWTDNNRIMWRGSDSHRHDLLSFKVELQEIFNKYKDKEFHFTILNPRELGFRVNNLVVHPPVPMFEFYKDMTEVNASHHIVLLEDNHFNRVKSHLAWLDGTLAGSFVFVPNYEEFIRPGAFNFSRQTLVEDFDAFMTIKDPKAKRLESWTEIRLKYLNSETNKRRLEILDSL